MSNEITTKAVEIGLNAAIVSVSDTSPMVLKVRPDEGDGRDSLPFGPFDPLKHRTMEMGLREFVDKQTGLRLGYVEQLYTFGDRGRLMTEGDEGPHVVSVGYLALSRPKKNAPPEIRMAGAEWRDWYTYFPWEDWREGRPAILDDVLLPKLNAWADSVDPYQKLVYGLSARQRVTLAFGLGESKWDEELVLDRYELLYSAGIVEEAVSDKRVENTGLSSEVGTPMLHDHRRIMATAISRLRGKLKYRPVIFELMQDEFTLFQLQKTVESIFGRAVHKQNFRRLVENNQLVEPTGATATATGGRPAALFRFRREVLQERPSPGLRVGGGMSRG